MDRTGIISARFFRNIGDYSLPPSVGSAVAAQHFQTWNIATDRRIAENQRILETNNAACKGFFEVASRNDAKARVRFGLEQARAQEGSEAVIRDQDGNVIAEP